MRSAAAARGSVFGTSKILVGKHLLEEVDSEEALDALLAHEAYHLQNLDSFVSVLSSLSVLVVGGQNVILSFYNIAESERAADRHAVSVVSQDALLSALRTCNRLQSENLIETATSGPAFLGSDTVDVHPVAEKWSDSEIRGRLRWLRHTVQSLLFAPYALLFGNVIYSQAHLDYRDRTDLLDLPNTIIRYLFAETTTTTVWLPKKQRIRHPVPREDVTDHLLEKGATKAQIEAAIDELIADGRVVVVNEDRLLWGGHV
jgi:hypothetical protein